MNRKRRKKKSRHNQKKKNSFTQAPYKIRKIEHVGGKFRYSRDGGICPTTPPLPPNPRRCETPPQRNPFEGNNAGFLFFLRSSGGAEFASLQKRHTRFWNTLLLWDSHKYLILDGWWLLLLCLILQFFFLLFLPFFPP